MPPHRLDPFPASWYVACFSDELRSAPLTRRLCGREIVLWRSGDGVVAMDAVCPHLGAHMGHGGVVVDGCLRCPFHHFRFRPDGSCAGTPYGGKTPPAARATTFPAEEHSGMVLVWHHPGGEAPTWNVPALPADGFTPLRHATIPLAAHPQETAENSVDLGHFTVVHGYRRPRITDGPRVDGSHLGLTYELERSAGRLGGGRLSLRLEVDVHGLGWSTVLCTTNGGGVVSRHWVLPRPTDAGRMEMQLAIAVRLGPRAQRPGVLRWLPGGLATRAARRLIFHEYVRDVRQDRVFWEQKRYLRRPALAEGDGPIGAYRRYCRQFYVDGVSPGARPTGSGRPPAG